MISNWLKEIDFYDKAGILVSTLCAIHCLLTPIIALFSPLVFAYFDNPLVHVIFLVFVLPIGVWAFRLGFKHHKNKMTYLSGIAGLLIVSFSVLFHIDWITIIGSLVLVFAHYKNRKACVCHIH